MLTIKNETSESADLYINGTIIDDEDSGWIKFWDEDTEGYQFPAELKRQLDGLKDKNLNVYINSYGGSVPAGLAMAHMLKRHKGKTTAIVDGYCCSIATQIFFSADECKMYSNSYLMIHKPWSYTEGNAEEMRHAAEVLDTIQKGLEEVYRSQKLSEVTDENIHDMVENETWLTGKEAAEKFKIKVLEAMPQLNCFGSEKKLKEMGAKKIPSTLNFLPVKADLNKVKIALARAKGVI